MLRELTEWFLRVALALAFLSAIADRLGFWGPPGAPGVAWGSWDSFVHYVAHLNWFLPGALVTPVAWLSTLLEAAIAIGLLVGWRLRWFALAGGLLLLSFGISMVIADGLKGPLDYSVFTAAAGALYLAAQRARRRSRRVFSRR